MYPASFLRARVYQWTFSFVLVCLGHTNMGNQGLAQDSTGFSPFDPRWEFPPARAGPFQVLSHACEEARTRELDVAYISLPPHLLTYARATQKFSRGSGAPAVLLQRNPNPWAPQMYPASFLRARVDQWNFSFVLVCLGPVSYTHL